MMSKTAALLALSATFALAAPKERDWQEGRLVNPHANRYFSTADLPDNGSVLVTADGARSSPGEELAAHPLEARSGLAYDHYIIEADGVAYLTELQRLNSFPAARVTYGPIKFAVEKNKLWLIADDQKEYETRILKQVPRSGRTLVTENRPPQPAAAPAPAPKPAKAPKPEPRAKPEPSASAKAEPPALAKSIVAPGTAVKKEPGSQLPVPAPATAPGKEQSRETFVGVKLTPKPDPEPAKQPAPAPIQASAKPTLKDRPWQAGKLLSAAVNPFFENVPFSTDMDGGSWSFSQGKDGKVSVSVRQVSLPTNPFTFDDYLIESEFCVYLVQHERQKSATPVRFNGTVALRFAVEKSRLWVIDEDGKEIETKIVKQLQREEPAPAPGLAQTAAAR